VNRIYTLDENCTFENNIRAIQWKKNVWFWYDL
jgi:hypothetical protein